MSFCQKGNQGLGIPQGELQRGIPDSFGKVFERLYKDGILKEGIKKPSGKEIGPWLLVLLENFKKSPNVSDRRQQATLIWAFREILGRDINF